MRRVRQPSSRLLGFCTCARRIRLHATWMLWTISQTGSSISQRRVVSSSHMQVPSISTVPTYCAKYQILQIGWAHSSLCLEVLATRRHPIQSAISAVTASCRYRLGTQKLPGHHPHPTPISTFQSDVISTPGQKLVSSQALHLPLVPFRLVMASLLRRGPPAPTCWAQSSYSITP